jgi:hypothetical protein
MAEQLMQWLQDSLLMESQQPSVRYQQEWLLARLMYHHLYLRDRLWDMFQQVSIYTKTSDCLIEESECPPPLMPKCATEYTSLFFYFTLL